MGPKRKSSCFQNTTILLHRINHSLILNTGYYTMKTLIVFVACLVCAAASDCGPLQRLKVKSQWEKVYGGSAEIREKFGSEVWIHVFLHDPKVKELFTRVRGDNVNSHEFKVSTQGLYFLQSILIVNITSMYYSTLSMTYRRDNSSLVKPTESRIKVVSL